MNFDIPETPVSFHNAVERALAATAMRRKKPRLLIGIVAAVVLSLSLVACIPAARAEVLKLFGIYSPTDYLAAGENRPPIETIETLIVPESEMKTEITVLDTGDFGEVSARMVEAFSQAAPAIELGETLFTGNELCISVRFAHGAGLFLVERYTGGMETAAIIPPEKLGGYFGGNAVPEEFASGEATFVERPQGFLTLTYADGSKSSLYLSLAEGDISAAIENPSAYADSFLAVGRSYTADLPDRLPALADENGIVEAEVTFTVSIVLDGDDSPATTVFKAAIGKVKLDVSGLTAVESRTPAAVSEPVVFAPQLVNIAKRNDETGEFSKHFTLDLAGLTLSLENNLTVGAFEIREPNVVFTFPEPWTSEQRALFMSYHGMYFRVLINGERGPWTPGAERIDTGKLEENPCAYTLDSIIGVPLDQYAAIETVSLIPYLIHYADGSDDPIVTEFPEYTLTWTF